MTSRAIAIAMQLQALALAIPATVDLWTGADGIQATTAAVMAVVGIVMGKVARE